MVQIIGTFFLEFGLCILYKSFSLVNFSNAAKSIAFSFSISNTARSASNFLDILDRVQNSSMADLQPF